MFCKAFETKKKERLNLLIHVILSEEHDLDHIPGRVMDLHCPTALIVDLFYFSQLTSFFCLCVFRSSCFLFSHRSTHFACCSLLLNCSNCLYQQKKNCTLLLLAYLHIFDYLFFPCHVFCWTRQWFYCSVLIIKFWHLCN